MRELADGRGLAGAVDPGDEDDVGLVAGIDVERPRHRLEDRGHFLRERRAHLVGAVAFDAGARDSLRHRGRGRDAEVGGDQELLDLLERASVEALPA